LRCSFSGGWNEVLQTLYSAQMKPVIEIRNISKRYQLGEKRRFYGSFREMFLQGLSKPLRKLRGSGSGSGWNGVKTPAPETFWALKDINFDVNGGDTIGIIGANGAGKSTLLKILSRITEPTEGEVRVQGRLASLLEVGTGFHPELTGRENVYLNGAILGMTKGEIDSKFDEIVDFSEIAKFLDTPVKRYSSGMYVRLAFAIAAHLDPDILVVDEVLAVGDVAFQRKCMAKMADARARARTVVFVSHSVSAVESLCNRAVVLQEGRVVFHGPTPDALNYYLHHVGPAAPDSRSHVVDLTAAPGRTAGYVSQLRRVELYTRNGRPVRGELPVGAPLKAVIHFELAAPCKAFHPSIAFDTLSGQRVCTAHSAYEPDRSPEQRSGEQVFVCDIPSLPLVPGEYKVGVGLDIGQTEVDWVDDVTRMTVSHSDYYGTGVVPTRGAFLLQNRWTLAHDTEETPA
jgi:homopolymeric O-antigen transport system ATP-binding protein